MCELYQGLEKGPSTNIDMKQIFNGDGDNCYCVGQTQHSRSSLVPKSCIRPLGKHKESDISLLCWSQLQSTKRKVSQCHG